MYYARSNQIDFQTPYFKTFVEVEEYLDWHIAEIIEWDLYTADIVGGEGTLVEFPCMHEGCDYAVNWPDTYCLRCAY